MVECDVEQFVRRQNVERYRKLLETAKMKDENTEELERLLAEEFRQHN